MERIEDIHRTIRQLKAITKYGMTCICILMTAHCGMLYYGHDDFLVHIAFWLFVFLIGYKLSCVFGLCWVHRLSVVYSMSVILGVAIRQRGLLSADILHVTRGVMFIIGMLMIGLNIWKATTNSRNSCKS